MVLAILQRWIFWEANIENRRVMWHRVEVEYGVNELLANE